MSVDINGKSAFPAINAHRARLEAQMEKLEKEGKENTRKYKRAAMALQKLQVMNFVTPGGEAQFSPEEFGKTASAEVNLLDAYLAGYCMEKKAEDKKEAKPSCPGSKINSQGLGRGLGIGGGKGPLNPNKLNAPAVSGKADAECLRGEPGKGQKENAEAGLPARGLGRETGQGRKRELLRILQGGQA